MTPGRPPLRHLLWLCPDTSSCAALAPFVTALTNAARDPLVCVPPHLTLASGPGRDGVAGALDALALREQPLTLHVQGGIQAPDPDASGFHVRMSLWIELTPPDDVQALQARACAALPGMEAPVGRTLHLSLGHTLASGAVKQTWLVGLAADLPAELRFDALEIRTDAGDDDFLARARGWRLASRARLSS